MTPSRPSFALNHYLVPSLVCCHSSCKPPAHTILLTITHPIPHFPLPTQLPTGVPVMSRSPWTSKYSPPLEDGVQPSEPLRALEIAANSAFDQYREQYYEGGVSSCYFWDNEGGFACCIVIKKSTPPKAHIIDEDADPRCIAPHSPTPSTPSWSFES